MSEKRDGGHIGKARQREHDGARRSMTEKRDGAQLSNTTMEQARIEQRNGVHELGAWLRGLR